MVWRRRVVPRAVMIYTEKYWSDDLKENDHLESLNFYCRIIFKRIIKNKILL
jgi:hypothetical protein